MHARQRVALLMVILAAWAPAAHAAADQLSDSERTKIEQLIKHVESMDARFVRNDQEYDAKTAAEFLRGKWKQRQSEVKSAGDFITKVATVSSTSGKPYRIRFKDGKEMTAGEFLTAQLKKLEQPGPPK